MTFEVGTQVGHIRRGTRLNAEHLVAFESFEMLDQWRKSGNAARDRLGFGAQLAQKRVGFILVYGRCVECHGKKMVV